MNDGSAGKFIASEIRMALAIGTLLVLAGYVDRVPNPGRHQRSPHHSHASAG